MKTDERPGYQFLIAQFERAKTDGLIFRGDQLKVAEIVGVHHSTVSKVLRGKYFNLKIIRTSLAIAESNRKELANAINILKSE